MTTFVSVIIPVYNDHKGIERCLSALEGQTYPTSAFEVIVVDNNSPQSIEPVVRPYKFARCVVEKKQGSYAARNTGTREARGELLGFTDADCIPKPEWITKATQHFEENPLVGGIAGGIFSGSGDTPVQKALEQRGFLSQTGTIQHPFLPYAQTANAWYRRDVFETVGFFEPDWLSGGDADFSWRMQLQTDYSLVHVPEAAIVHNHRADIKSLFRQCWKWGYGQEALSRKYHPLRAINSSQKSFDRLYSLGRLATLVVVRSFQEKLYGRLFQDKHHHMVRLAIEAGLEFGQLCGKISSPPRASREW